MSLSVICPSCRATLHVREEYAGQQMKCPRCNASVPVHAEEEPVTVQPVDAVTGTAPPPPPSGPTKPCPACGRQIALAARKCRFCRTWLRDEDDDYDDDDRPRASYKPCPRCGAADSERVLFTFWGSFYGPALLTHVRCPECGYAYNGRTGRSNLVPAIIFVAVPLVLILAILTGLVVILSRAMS
jgi:predicted RNA-binding Zn-ribbon protein involved in translation (DUF1610 family)